MARARRSSSLLDTARQRLAGLNLFLVITTSFPRIMLGLLLVITSVHAQSPIKYIPSDEDIANPERGLFQYKDNRVNKKDKGKDIVDQVDTPLEETSLRNARINKRQTVVYRHYYLKNFRTIPFDKKFLDFLDNDATIARRAGVKLIVRFAYTDSDEIRCDNSDPSLSQVLAHLEQLKDYFRNNNDVMTLVEAGFIGTWGEWYYSNATFGCEGNPVYSNRAMVLWRLMEIVPANRMLAIRTPFHKRAIIEEWKKQSRPAAEIAANATRIGYHDDAFLADGTDLGTFKSEDDRIMVEGDTVRAPMVGETSTETHHPNPYGAWKLAEAALKKYHWSLISNYDDGKVFKDWNPVQVATFKRSLGYRFVLLDGSYPDKAKAGTEIEIKVKIRNDGWASPFNQRPVYLVLRNAAKKDEVRKFELRSTDPRNWQAQTTSPLSATVKLDVGLPPGAYGLYLYLPDSLLENTCAKTSCDAAAYAIRFANKDLWESTTGYNSLNHKLKVD